MTSSNRLKTLLPLATVAMASLFLTINSARAAEIVDPGKIVGVPTFGVTGTLVAIDVPFVTTGNYPQSGGPIWVTSGSLIANTTDNGFTTRDFGIREPFQVSPWEPDGTPISEARDQGTFPTGNPNVSYNFNLAASGIDIPDGAIVNGVYATWTPRGGGDGATYAYSEGADSDTLAQTHTVAPAGDLVLSWLDDINVERNGNFQRLFAGPITVADGDGFELTLIDNLGNAAHIDAVVLDVSLPAAIPEPTSVAIWSLIGLGLVGFGYYRVRRKK